MTLLEIVLIVICLILLGALIFMTLRNLNAVDYIEELEDENQRSKDIMKEFSTNFFILSKNESIIAQYEPIVLELLNIWRKFFSKDVEEFEKEYKKQEEERLKQNTSFQEKSTIKM